MNSKIKSLLYVLIIFLSLAACKDETPKYTPVNSNTTMPSTTDPNLPIPGITEDIHTATVNKILKTEKYLYLNVTEKGHSPFWIATRKVAVKVGGTYFYKGGLLKTNFESKEFNRVFDTIYLVSSNLVPANHGSNPNFQSNMKTDDKTTPVVVKDITVKGSIKIADLVKNAKKYEGKTVQISGTCTKLNADIMGRNWIHLKDGSKTDFDMVVTSSELVKEGETVTMQATVTLNKDFGAGYKYDIILENGVIVK